MFYQKRSESCYIKLAKENGTSYSTHIHKEVELFYVKEGKIKMTIGQNTKIMTPGMVSICFPNLPHSVENLGAVVSYPLIFDVSFASDYSNELYNMSPEYPFLDAEIGSKLESIFFNIDTLVKAHNDSRMIKGYLYQLLGSILNNLVLTGSISTNKDTCELLLDYINSHYTENITLNSISLALGYNKFYISHLFNDKLNLSFTEYLNNCRIEHSINLLNHSDYSITDICFLCGFNSIRTFYRTFERRFQCTPKQYKITKYSENNIQVET